MGLGFVLTDKPTLFLTSDHVWGQQDGRSAPQGIVVLASSRRVSSASIWEKSTVHAISRSRSISSVISTKSPSREARTS